MNRLVTTLAALLAIVSACGSKKDEPKPKADENAKPAVPETRPQPAPKPEPKPAVAATAKLDCDALVTAADIETTCGAKISAWKSDAMETKSGPAYCSRRAGPSGGFIRLLVGIYPHTEAAKMITRGGTSTKAAMEKKRAGKAMLEIAHTRVNNVAVTVRSQYIGGKKPLCTSEQLAALARTAASRLPSG